MNMSLRSFAIALSLKYSTFEKHKGSVFLTGDPGYDPPIW